MFYGRVKRLKSVNYSYEYGDKSLPYLKDLVSEKEDPEKQKIMSYLRKHNIAACPGIVEDVIEPDKTIGYGDLYSDGVYIWDDVFFNYVKKYNIPVPEEFRTHILNNFYSMMKKHMMLQLIDSVQIISNPYLDYHFDVRIYRNGLAQYQRNNADGVEIISVDSKRVERFIDEGLQDLFCYDVDDHGQAVIDGYHWKLIFYRKEEVVSEVEGWPNEDSWRYNEISSIISWVESIIQKDMGSNYMPSHDDE